jgi:murein DD-endopeptidase MepM/ murein hydrolase activator NlpD
VELSSTEQIAPAGAASAQFVAFPSKLEAGGSLVAHFDDLYFRNTPLFADGFESGDLTSWSSTTQPILTMTPYVNQSQIAGLWWPYCDSGDCPWEPPTQKHDGLDFTPNEDLVPFQAAAPGVVYEVALFENTGNDFWQVNVMVSCSPDNAYGLIYAFEPMTSSQADGEWQLDNIEVQAGTVVSPGDVIGSLYQGAEYAHVHFGIWENWQQTCPEPFLSTPVRTELRDLIQSESGHEDWEICN